MISITAFGGPCGPARIHPQPACTEGSSAGQEGEHSEVLSAEGRALARGLWSGTSTRALSFDVCGQRRLVLRVTGTRVPGPFQLTATRP